MAVETASAIMPFRRSTAVVAAHALVSVHSRIADPARDHPAETATPIESAAPRFASCPVLHSVDLPPDRHGFRAAPSLDNSFVANISDRAPLAARTEPAMSD
jgi:hypothetical protein